MTFHDPMNPALLARARCHLHFLPINIIFSSFGIIIEKDLKYTPFDQNSKTLLPFSSIFDKFRGI